MKTLLSQVIDTSQEQKQEQKTVQKQSTTYKNDVPTPSNYGVVHN